LSFQSFYKHFKNTSYISHCAQNWECSKEGENCSSFSFGAYSLRIAASVVIGELHRGTLQQWNKERVRTSKGIDLKANS
jgi:hypothetical protein